MCFLCVLPTELDLSHLTYVSQSESTQIEKVFLFIVSGDKLNGVFLLQIQHVILLGGLTWAKQSTLGSCIH